jgi:hypothetical protein
MFQDGALHDSRMALTAIDATPVNTTVKALSNYQQNFQSTIQDEETTDMTDECEVRSSNTCRKRKKMDSKCCTSITSNYEINVRLEEVQE